MRIGLLVLVASMALADSPEALVPRPEPPKNLQIKVPESRWWVKVEKARTPSGSACNPSEVPLGHVKQDRFLMPYPYQAPQSLSLIHISEPTRPY